MWNEITNICADFRECVSVTWNNKRDDYRQFFVCSWKCARREVGSSRRQRSDNNGVKYYIGNIATLYSRRKFSWTMPVALLTPWRRGKVTRSPCAKASVVLVGTRSLLTILCVLWGDRAWRNSEWPRKCQSSRQVAAWFVGRCQGRRLCRHYARATRRECRVE